MNSAIACPWFRAAQSRLLVSILIALCADGAVLAQTAPAAATPPAATPASVPVYRLNPYDVTAERDNGYEALNSNAITRFSMPLQSMPVSADIYTKTLMDDLAADTIETMIAANSPGAGLSALDAASAGAQQFDHVAHNYIQLRGFDTSVMQRDSLMPIGPLFNPGSTGAGQTSNFDVQRVEVIEGPQALLYSGGGPGGVVNVVSKTAYFNQNPTGSLLYRIDQYGSKYGALDYGQGAGRVAVRVALLDQDEDTRRVNVGQRVTGAYVQLAVKPAASTTVRFDFEQTTQKGGGSTPGVNLSTAANDTRSGLELSYLQATNQTGANTLFTNGAPNAAGAIYNGMLNWNNLDSLSGLLAAEYTRTRYLSATIDTVVNPNLSTEVAVGYSESDYSFRSGAATLTTPTATTNPTGQWALSSSPSETDEPGRNKAIRASAIYSGDLFNGLAHSQTILGGDFVGSQAHSIAYSYWLADANFNPVYSSAIATNNGRTKLPTQFYSIQNGIAEYPFFPVGTPRFTVGGVNYVRMPTNQVNPTLISPSNPAGLSSPAGLNEFNIIDNKGVFLTNATQWGSDNRLTTLAGLRANDSFDSLLYIPPVYRVVRASGLDFDLGANYALFPWLSPYVAVSDAVTPPQTLFPDPAGNLPVAGRGIGEEVGVKFSNKSQTISGSLAVYHAYGKNEEFAIPAGVSSAINPAGLNGSFAGSAGTGVDLDRKSNGLQAIISANPDRHWRLRLTAAIEDGRVMGDKTYSPLYNDQFFENSLGQVTFADGTVVFVNSTAFSSKTPVVASTSAGAVPLTVALMNSPTSLYFASPVAPSDAILSSSAVATVLKAVDPVHGAILTGATGLPISKLQIAPPNGIPAPITVFKSGQRVRGTPLYSMNFTSVYGFDEGLLKGLSVGASVNAAFDLVQFYYPLNGFASANPALAEFKSPTSIVINPIISYERKYRRFTFKTQLNISNVLNHYDVVIQPSTATGFQTLSAVGANFYGQPRTYTWSNTISF